MFIHCAIIIGVVGGGTFSSPPLGVGHFLLLGFFIFSFAAPSGAQSQTCVTVRCAIAELVMQTSLSVQLQEVVKCLSVDYVKV
jgi:hypothetical protein